MSILHKTIIFALIMAMTPILIAMIFAGFSFGAPTNSDNRNDIDYVVELELERIADQFDRFFSDGLYIPLQIIQTAIGGRVLRADGKITVLERGLNSLPFVVSLQVNIEGLSAPIMVSNDEVLSSLKSQKLNVRDVLQVDPLLLESNQHTPPMLQSVAWIEEIGVWIGTVKIPVTKGIAGRRATLFAQVDLKKLKTLIEKHPLGKKGRLQILTSAGQILFSPKNEKHQNKILTSHVAAELQKNSSQTTVEKHRLGNEKTVMFVTTSTRSFPWAIVFEMDRFGSPVFAKLSWHILAVSLFGLGIIVSASALFEKWVLGSGRQASRFAPQFEEPDVDAPNAARKFPLESGVIGGSVGQPDSALSEQSPHSINRKQQKTPTDSASRKPPDSKEIAVIVVEVRDPIAAEKEVASNLTLESNIMLRETLVEVATLHDCLCDKLNEMRSLLIFEGPDKSIRATDCAIGLLDRIEEIHLETDAEIQLAIAIDIVRIETSDEYLKNGDFSYVRKHNSSVLGLVEFAIAGQLLVTQKVLTELPRGKAEMATGFTPKSIILGFEHEQFYTFTSSSTFLLSNLVDD